VGILFKEHLKLWFLGFLAINECFELSNFVLNPVRITINGAKSPSQVPFYHGERRKKNHSLSPVGFIAKIRP
jgi:hypothetical protein